MKVQILDHHGQPMAQSYSGAGAGFGNQLINWTPSPKTKDAALLPELKLGNSRADDLVRNHGIAANGVQLHVDNIVGHLFRLSYKPRFELLGIPEQDADKFASDVEQAWLEFAEDDQCYLDAERKRTFTMMVREGISTHTTAGEILASAEYITRRNSPLKTCIKTLAPLRLSNPHHVADTQRLKGGVESDKHGAATAYHFCEHADTGYFGGNGLGQTWKRVERETRWGRPKILHIFEPGADGQTRGENQFLSVMEQLHMLSKLQHTKLQNAIVNAMYAAVIESDLDSAAAMELIGADASNINVLQKWMGAMLDYHEGANIRMNGVKVPHLMSGEHLKMQTSGNVDNGFAELEKSILRWCAAGLNLPYEALSRNYSETTYSSARASMLDGWRYFMGRRKIIASRYASLIFGLWFEEAIVDKQMVSMPKARRGFYDARSSWLNANWIGAGRVAIDGLKEVKEAVMRVEGGLSTYEKEAAIMGEDYRELFKQQVREMRERKAAGLPQASWMATQTLAPDTAVTTTDN